jgi:hypothetical protein
VPRNKKVTSTVDYTNQSAHSVKYHAPSFQDMPLIHITKSRNGIPIGRPTTCSCIYFYFSLSVFISGFGGLVVSMPAFGTQDRGFEPGRSRRIFSGVKIHSMPSFGREEKQSIPCRRFVARKRSRGSTLEVGSLRLNSYSIVSRPTNSLLR